MALWISHYFRIAVGTVKHRKYFWLIYARVRIFLLQ